jgi:hypothetical protein
VAAKASGPTPGEKNAKALVALGPTQAGDAVASLMEESSRAAADSKGKISELEREVAELRAQVRSHQVAELVPRIKESLLPLGGGAAEQLGVRTSALAAAAGLGISMADPKAACTFGVGAGAVGAAGKPAAASAAEEKPEAKAAAAAPGGTADGKKGKAAAAPKKGPAKPVLQSTPLRVAAAVAVGDLEVFVQARA